MIHPITPSFCLVSPDFKLKFAHLLTEILHFGRTAVMAHHILLLCNGMVSAFLFKVYFCFCEFMCEILEWLLSAKARSARNWSSAYLAQTNKMQKVANAVKTNCSEILEQ